MSGYIGQCPFRAGLGGEFFRVHVRWGGLGGAGSTGAPWGYKKVEVTKETRANLWFLTIFLALTLPGGVILFKKKLDPSSHLMYMPDSPRHRLPYNSPEEAGDLKRYVPEKTGEWVTELAGRHGYTSVLSRDRLPVMLGGRRWQLIGTRAEEGGTRADLLLWGGEPPNLAVEWSVTEGAGATPGRAEAAEPLVIPEAVRKELVKGGFPKPPKEASWVRVVFPGLTPSSSSRADARIEMRETTPTGIRSDSVPLFTN